MKLLFCLLQETTTQVKDIYNVFVGYFYKNNNPLENIVLCVADGLPAMIGKKDEFLKLLSNVIKIRLNFIV